MFRSIRVFIQDNQGLPTGQGSETYGPRGFCMFAQRPTLVVFQPIGLFSSLFSKLADQKLSKWHENAVRVWETAGWTQNWRELPKTRRNRPKTMNQSRKTHNVSGVCRVCRGCVGGVSGTCRGRVGGGCRGRAGGVSGVCRGRVGKSVFLFWDLVFIFFLFAQVFLSKRLLLQNFSQKQPRMHRNNKNIWTALQPIFLCAFCSKLSENTCHGDPWDPTSTSSVWQVACHIRAEFSKQKT